MKKCKLYPIIEIEGKKQTFKDSKGRKREIGFYKFYESGKKQWYVMDIKTGTRINVTDRTFNETKYMFFLRIDEIFDTIFWFESKYPVPCDTAKEIVNAIEKLFAFSRSEGLTNQ